MSSIKLFIIFALSIASIMYSLAHVSFRFDLHVPHVSTGKTVVLRTDFPLQTQLLTERLLAFSPTLSRPLSITYTDEPASYRYTANYFFNEISANKALTELLREKTGDDSNVIAIIAHEIAHLSTRVNFNSDIPSESRNGERFADYLAIKILHKAGFDCDLFKDGFTTMHNLVLVPDFDSDSHPSTRSRIAEGDRACKFIKNYGILPLNLYFEK